MAALSSGAGPQCGTECRPQLVNSCGDCSNRGLHLVTVCVVHTWLCTFLSRQWTKHRAAPCPRGPMPWTMFDMIAVMHIRLRVRIP
jgi:hypothetical protein